MQYNNVYHGIFSDRPNRFIAHVWLDGNLETVHVKNTGRCRELLKEGVQVALEKSQNPNRKTQYDLIAVYREGYGWINIDSQAPNKVMLEFLERQNFDVIIPEYRYGDSRIDFYMEKNGAKYLLEVKGCTLFVSGKGYFPDAPTQRGIKHLKELEKAAKEGYHARVAFVIGGNDIRDVYPNDTTHPEFGDALLKAKHAGVEQLNIRCFVSPDTFAAADENEWR